ncbi:MAG TPA: hypothetical protein VN732_02480 [Solirubrobacterales bacterium]|nr:hypothetical protein [Solirubrobacterales bacterium]
MSKHLIRILLLATSLLLILAAGAAGDRKVECVANLCLTDDGGILPTKLPRHGTAPITARLFGEVETRDGSHPPALRSADIEIDRTIEIDAVGLPTCRFGQLRATSSAAARRACEDAIVGSGRAKVEVSFPEQSPIVSSGPVLIFNGGVHGKTTDVFLHAYVNVPAPTAVVVKATVRRIRRGPYGLEIKAQIPKIAGGAGSATRFDLSIGREYTYKGQKKSFLEAGCPTGRWLARGQAGFEDGTRVALAHVFTCTASH